MFGRPRCREWTPLVTQQLRLRSLIQIVGYNIRPPEWCALPCSFYLTLHHTTMSAPFYTSERVSSPHPKWKEIDSEITQRMSSTNVVIRIWCHVIHPGKDLPQDTVIQTWGVYLSGLRYIGANLASNFNSDCFKSNTLVFQLHGGYFCSYKSLKLDVIPPENELEHGSLSSDSSGKTNLSKITLDARHILKFPKESRSISPSKHSRSSEREYSKSHSPKDRTLQQNFATVRMSASLNIGPSKDDSKFDPNSIYEHSPENLDVKEFSGVNCDNLDKKSLEDLASKIDLSETAESYDLRSENDGVPKYRYMALNFLKSEIRPSYTAAKLQKLHLLQYSIKKRQEAVQEIKERIYKKSSVTEGDWSQDECSGIKFKSRSQRNLFSPDGDGLGKDKCGSQSELSVKNGRVKEERPVSNGPRLTLKLNDLLSFKSKPSPYQRAEHIRLTKQMEILRFKRIILSDERDSKLANIRRLKERRAKLYEENQDVASPGSELMQNYHALSRSNDVIRDTRQSCVALRELAAASYHALCTQRSELLAQLHQIFYIEQKDPSTWTILDVPLPICGDETPRNSALSDSVAAGYVAQAVCLAAALLNQPIRYNITLLGSASKILDVAPDLPDPNIPLFARGGDSTLFRYALFLLNKCVAQLCHGRSVPVVDIRPTLANLRTLLTQPLSLSESRIFGTRWASTSGESNPRAHSLRSLVASERGKYRSFNRFKEAVDGHSPQTAMNLKRHRHSRSVGSYHDDQDLPALDDSTTSIMGSESNIYNMKLPQDEQALKSHNSDSEIHRIGEESKVIFTLGDDSISPIDIHEKLVRISIHNEDELIIGLENNVHRICSEITEFCSTSKVHEGVDIVKHLDDIDFGASDSGVINTGQNRLGSESPTNRTQ